MPISETLRPLLPLVIGLAIGGLGVGLFQDSLPGEKDSPEALAKSLELELKSSQKRIAELEAAGPGKRSQRTVKDGLRDLAEDIRDGKSVSPDDIFRATQPFLRDVAPLLDRVRQRQMEKDIDSRVGAYAREYDLTPAQQKTLKEFFARRAEEEAKRYNDLVLQDGTTVPDLVKFGMDSKPEQGIDEIMEKTLSGEKLANYKTERMAERSRNVQSEADARVQRLDKIVGLDNTQRDAVFGIAARDSDDYDPAMGIEGLNGAISTTTGASPHEAMLSVLRPDQRKAYEAENQLRKDEARKDMEAYGLTLPPSWDMLDEGGF
jgi:hypothetical protein